MHTLSPESPVVSPSPSIRVSFMWDRGEHQRLIRQVTRHAKVGPYARYGACALLVMVGGSLALSMVTDGWRGFASAFPWVLILAFWWTLFRYAAPWLAARAYPKQHPCVTQPFFVSLAGEGVRTTCNHSDVLVKWDGVRRAVETREFVLLYSSDRCAHYLPKRALNGAGELERAREMVLRHMPLQDATNR